MAFFEIDSIEYTDDLYQSYWSPSIPSTSRSSIKYLSRVLSQSGIVQSMPEVSQSLSLAMSNNYYEYISGWFSAQFGWRNAGSNKVVQWFDLSPEEKDFYANIPSWQPVWTENQKNSKPGLYFDGSDDNMRRDYADIKTIFLVFKSNSTGDWYKHILGNSWSDTWFHGGMGTAQWYPGSGPMSVPNYVNGISVNPTTLQKTTNYEILTLTHYDFLPVQQLCWAQDNFSYRAYPGTFLEIIFLSIKADTSLRQQIETDLNSRWAIY